MSTEEDVLQFIQHVSQKADYFQRAADLPLDQVENAAPEDVNKEATVQQEEKPSDTQEVS